MGSRISRVFIGLILYSEYVRSCWPVSKEVFFLHQTLASTGTMYIYHRFLWGGFKMYICQIFLWVDSWIRHYTGRMTISHVFSNNHPTTFCIPYVNSRWRINSCVACIHGPTYMRVEREPSWGRSDHFSQRYIFCLYTRYNIDHVLCMVCLCAVSYTHLTLPTKA